MGSIRPPSVPLLLALVPAVATVPGAGCAPLEDLELGFDERAELPPEEDLGVLELASISCDSWTDTGYVNGNPFPITLVTVDGKPAEIASANAYYVMQQAAAHDGVSIRVVSGFRTYAEQAYLYNCYVTCSCNNCNLAARPGYSNHQSGHAFDLNTSTWSVLNWLNNHGGAYGFRRTVPSENWHWEWWGGGPGGGPCQPCHPEPEVCNGKDDDCDDQIDEGVTRTCGTDVGECEEGTERCAGGAWGPCTGAIPPAPELCDGLDNDCDSVADDEQVCELEEVVAQAALIDRQTDVDGDGLAELCGRSERGFACYQGTGHGFGRALDEVTLPPGLDGEDLASTATLHLGDLDGDGRADLCGRGIDGVSCWRSDGTGFPLAHAGPRLTDADGWARPAQATTLQLADVDGDGRDDLCGRAADGFRCWPSTGAGFAGALATADFGDAAGWDDVALFGTLRMGDVDGDGRDDVCGRGREGVTCLLADGRGFGERIVGPAWSDARGWDRYDRWSTIRLVDVDGDRRADLCGRGPDGFVCHLSTGAGFDEAHRGPALADDAGWSDRALFSTLRMDDIDGDGARDLCARDRAGVVCWLWTGRGFERQLDGPPLADEAGWDQPSWYRSLRLADLDGDGRADLSARAADGVRAWHSSGLGFPTLVLAPAFADASGWGPAFRASTLRVGASAPGAAEAGAAEGIEGGCQVGGRRARPGGRAGAAALLALAALAAALRAGLRRRAPARPAAGT